MRTCHSPSTGGANAKETATGQCTHNSGGKTSGGRVQPRLRHGSQKPLSVEVWRASPRAVLVIGTRRSPGLRY